LTVSKDSHSRHHHHYDHAIITMIIITMIIQLNNPKRYNTLTLNHSARTISRQHQPMSLESL